MAPRSFRGSSSHFLICPSLTESASSFPFSLALSITRLSPLTSPLLSPHTSTSAKIRAIEAKLQMMEENPDDFSGPSAYVYNKPPEKKRWEPYSRSNHKHQSRPFRRFRR